MTVNIVNALMVNDGQVLMALRSASRAHSPGCWSFPGGHVEDGEDLDAAVKRELREETGVTPTALQPIGNLRKHGLPSEGFVDFYFYAVWRWVGPLSNRSDEHDLIEWVPVTGVARQPDLALPEYPELAAKAWSVAQENGV